MSLWLIVPVKSLADGKSRLARALGPEERRELNERLLAHTLDVACVFPGVQRTLVVSRCADALLCAKGRGFPTLREAPPHGLNSALRQARTAAAERGATTLLVAASDLPLLRADDLRELAATGSNGGVVIATDRKGRGTNALYLPQYHDFAFRFGEGSRLDHEGEAQRLGLPVSILQRERLAFDLDDPEDLQAWPGVSRTHAVRA
jgi:2-phospho-L-lactate/phosphoenolpyruvate guanylyltransferase